MMTLDPIGIAAIASCLGAVGTFMIGVVSMMSLLQGNTINKRGVENAAMLRTIDTNVNGHLTRLTEMASGVDPLVAALAAAKVMETAAATAKAEIAAPPSSRGRRLRQPPARRLLRNAPAKAK